MQKITPHLWFDKQVREAAEFYVSLFPGSKITSVTTLSGTPSGDCDLVSFEMLCSVTHQFEPSFAAPVSYTLDFENSCLKQRSIATDRDSGHLRGSLL
jgi:predicted 3-demethylubiquinone-9 3-methyltransferase (glyoxalase superfamily)